MAKFIDPLMNREVVIMKTTRGVDIEINFETGIIKSNLPERQARELASLLWPEWVREATNNG